VLDHVFLPDVHEKVHDAVLGKRTSGEQNTVAILETDTIAANIHAAEAAVKGTEVQLVELRLAEYEMSGKAISVYSGELHEVQAAMTIANDSLRGRQAFTHYRIIARPHEVIAQQLDQTTRYHDAKLHELEGEEAS
jgi:microcompartment protein CcmL/EutN